MRPPQPTSRSSAGGPSGNSGSVTVSVPSGAPRRIKAGARSGLTALDTIGGSLMITSNERLPLATAEALRDQVGIDDIGADVVILNNGP